ncbi:uncharacterized protein IL334_006453 [Kwoniella shivajii]|uniref:Mif2 N-terminal domain-containing protein n=1 Tax=Kwoniella shivajii TaxID=564305 RepID=A0ABZ1D774_9TREE|nr:hypothetical protein IL334_006453 [Kwoniella shivajii]
MSTRSSIRSRTTSHPTHSHSHTSVTSLPLQRTSSKPGSSRPGTPSRGDIPTSSRKPSSSSNPIIPNKSQSPILHSSPLPTPMSEQPSTPTPRKTRRTPRRGNKASNSRNVPNGSDRAPGPEQGSGLHLDHDGEQEPSSEDEVMLFDLLGVSSPQPKASSPRKGVLNLSKEDMDNALGKKPKSRKSKKDIIADNEGDITRQPNINGSPAPSKKGGRNVRQKQGQNGDEKAANSEGDLPQESKGRKGRNGLKSVSMINRGDNLESDNDGDLLFKPKPKQSGLGATKPRNVTKFQSSSQIPLVESDSLDSFDTSSLSQSLPAGGLNLPPATKNLKQKKTGKKAGSDDESAVWDMPPVAGGQELTWQQKLQGSAPPSSESSPRKSSKSTPSDKKKSNRCVPFQQQQQQSVLPAVSSPLVPRPVHNRRASADGVPTATIGPTGNSGNGRLISAFDGHIPFHTGYNVHRAPQTPAKGVASANGNMSTSLLPIVGSGEFPRLQGQSQGERKGSITGSGTGPAPGSAPPNLNAKYAGPTFHNSPNAATLSKPDLDDF